MNKHDLSTLNVAALAKLPVLGELPMGYHLQRDPGNGCYLDPPGYPSYFTRSVYTPDGANPGRGPTMVIASPTGQRVVATADTEWLKGDTWDAVHARHKAQLRSLYAPLPFDHARVQAWVAAVHHHLQHCYADDAGVAEPPEYGRPGMVVFPVPSYKLRSFTDDARFSDDWRAKEQAAIEQYNADKRAAYTKVAVLDNHLAVRRIRAFYPDYNPGPGDVIAAEESPRPGDWWERCATRPTPAECEPGGHLKEHRSAGWCQFCGSIDGVQS